MSLSTESKDIYYTQLMSRYRDRSQFLREAGFVYKVLTEYGIAIFTKQRPKNKGLITIPSTFVIHADDLVWQDRLDEISLQEIFDEDN